jgi:hypothetical protein
MRDYLPCLNRLSQLPTHFVSHDFGSQITGGALKVGGTPWKFWRRQQLWATDLIFLGSSKFVAGFDFLPGIMPGNICAMLAQCADITYQIL